MLFDKLDCIFTVKESCMINLTINMTCNYHTVVKTISNMHRDASHSV